MTQEQMERFLNQAFAGAEQRVREFFADWSSGLRSRQLWSTRQGQVEIETELAKLELLKEMAIGHVKTARNLAMKEFKEVENGNRMVV